MNVVPMETIFLTSEEAAFFLRLPSVKAFYEVRQQHPRSLRGRRVGKRLLFTERELRRWADRQKVQVRG